MASKGRGRAYNDGFVAHLISSKKHRIHKLSCDITKMGVTLEGSGTQGGRTNKKRNVKNDTKNSI